MPHHSLPIQAQRENTTSLNLAPSFQWSFACDHFPANPFTPARPSACPLSCLQPIPVACRRGRCRSIRCRAGRHDNVRRIRCRGRTSCDCLRPAHHRLWAWSGRIRSCLRCWRRRLRSRRWGWYVRRRRQAGIRCGALSIRSALTRRDGRRGTSSRSSSDRRRLRKHRRQDVRATSAGAHVWRAGRTRCIR